jgi:hypothetical protein
MLLISSNSIFWCRIKSSRSTILSMIISHHTPIVLACITDVMCNRGRHERSIIRKVRSTPGEVLVVSGGRRDQGVGTGTARSETAGANEESTFKPGRTGASTTRGACPPGASRRLLTRQARPSVRKSRTVTRSSRSRVIWAALEVPTCSSALRRERVAGQCSARGRHESTCWCGRKVRFLTWKAATGRVAMGRDSPSTPAIVQDAAIESGWEMVAFDRRL